MRSVKRKPTNEVIFSKEDFAKRMLLLAGAADQFVPTATYDPDGDCVEFLAKPDPYYGERLDNVVTVYYSQETGEVVGSLINGISKFCREFAKKNPGFNVMIQNGRIRLEHLFLARLWSSTLDPQEIKALTYRKLIEVAGETAVEGKLCAT